MKTSIPPWALRIWLWRSLEISPYTIWLSSVGQWLWIVTQGSSPYIVLLYILAKKKCRRQNIHLGYHLGRVHNSMNWLKQWLEHFRTACLHQLQSVQPCWPPTSTPCRHWRTETHQTHQLTRGWTRHWCRHSGLHSLPCPCYITVISYIVIFFLLFFIQVV